MISDYNEFKNEIMKKIRLLENKFSTEFNSKFSEISKEYEKLETKMNTIYQNNNSLLELIAKLNLNYEKINDIEKFKSKAGQELLSHEIKIKNIIQDIDKLKIRYDKIISENLIVPGFVGPGGIYKNMAEYVEYQMSEFQKIRNETEQTKNKVDNSAKDALEVVKNSLVKFQKYTDEKNNDTQIILERKYNQFNEKILEFETELNKYQFKVERQMDPIQKEIQNLKIKTESPFLNENNIRHINEKINILLEDFDNIKNNKEIDKIISNNNSSDLLNTKNTSKFQAINNNKFNNVFNISSYNSLKNSKNLLNSEKVHKNHQLIMTNFQSKMKL